MFVNGQIEANDQKRYMVHKRLDLMAFYVTLWIQIRLLVYNRYSSFCFCKKHRSFSFWAWVIVSKPKKIRFSWQAKPAFHLLYRQLSTKLDFGQCDMSMTKSENDGSLIAALIKGRIILIDCKWFTIKHRWSMRFHFVIIVFRMNISIVSV